MNNTHEEKERQEKKQPKFNHNQLNSQGYTGEKCRNCGSMRVRQNGTCSMCEECGTTTGCS